MVTRGCRPRTVLAAAIGRSSSLAHPGPSSGRGPWKDRYARAQTPPRVPGSMRSLSRTLAGLSRAQPVPRLTATGTPLSIAMIGLRGIPSTYGGVERAVEELSASLALRGHDVTVYARRGYSDRAVLHHRGVTIVHRGQIHTKHLEAASHTTISLLDAMR